MAFYRDLDLLHITYISYPLQEKCISSATTIFFCIKKMSTKKELGRIDTIGNAGLVSIQSNRESWIAIVNIKRK